MTKQRTRLKEYIGTWRITEMDQWDMDYIDMASPGRIVIDKNEQGEIHFGVVDVEIDYRLESLEMAGYLFHPITRYHLRQ